VIVANLRDTLVALSTLAVLVATTWACWPRL